MAPATSLLTFGTCLRNNSTFYTSRTFFINLLQIRMASGEPTASPWYASFPTPRTTTPGAITREALLEIMKSNKEISGKNYILVDLRRTDHEGSTIRGSINLPAQSLYPTIPTVYNMFKAAGITKVIWYCSSSRGRGTRAAGWFSDYIDEQGDKDMESLFLFEGIKGWAQAGGECIEWIDGYDKAAWESKETSDERKPALYSERVQNNKLM